MEKSKLKQLLELKALLNEAIKSQRRSDKCISNYIQKTNKHGFNRSTTTSFNAAATHNASALKSDMKALKSAFITLFKMEMNQCS